MRARERLPPRNHGQTRLNGVQVPPDVQRPDEGHHQDVRVGTTEPSLPDEPLRQLPEAGESRRHAVEQVDAALPGEPEAVGHQQAEQLPLFGSAEALEQGFGQPLERLSGVDGWLVDERGESRDPVVVVGHDDRLEQRVLARKVVVDGALAHAHGRRDVTQAGAEIAVLGEEFERRVE